MEKINIETKCNLCDISIECHWTPGRGRGYSHTVMYLLPSPTKSDYKNGICTSRNTKKIQQFNDEYNFLAYYTTLVKCVTKETPRRVELDNCRTRFQKELFEVSPKIIITIGDVVTSEILEYKYFKDVVDKPHILTINNQKVIIYPIYHPSYVDKEQITEIYNKSFATIAKLYKAFINSNYLIIP